MFTDRCQYQFISNAHFHMPANATKYKRRSRKLQVTYTEIISGSAVAPPQLEEEPEGEEQPVSSEAADGDSVHEDQEAG